MKLKRVVPLNLSAAAALLVVLWQAEAGAQTREEGKGVGRGRGAPRARARKATRLRAPRRVRRLSRMRERARLLEPYIVAAARKYGVDPRVLWTICYLETRFKSGQVSPKKAEGWFQFMPATARHFGLKNPHDPKESAEAAARYVRELSARFGGRLDLVLAGYNAGEGTVDAYLTGRTLRTRDGKIINPRGRKTGGIPPYKETQNYVSRGLIVYTRVTSAGVFSPEVLAHARGMKLLPARPSDALIRSVNAELAELGTAPATAAPVRAAKVVANIPPGAPEEVFFDVHSGARYLVKGGQIVRPLEASTGGAADATARAELARRATPRVVRSIYLGTRGE